MSVDVFGLNGNQTEADTARDRACDSISRADAPNAAQADLLSTCSVLDALGDDLASLGAGLDRLIPEESFVVGDTLVEAADVQVSWARSRSGARRRGGRVTPPDDAEASAAGAFDLPRGGGAASDGGIERALQLFVAAYVSGGEYDGGELQQDADIDANRLTVGFDYRLDERFVVGTALGLLRHDIDFRDEAGGMSADRTDVALFGSYFGREGTYMDVLLEFGSGRYELERQINLVDSERVIASADTSATTLSVVGGLGRTFAFDAWRLGPHLRAHALFVSVDGYSEMAESMQPGFGSTLSVASQTIRSSAIFLGARLSRTITSSKVILVPQFSAELQFETQRNKDDIDARFTADPDGNLFVVEGEERDASSANIGAGSSAVFAGGLSAYVFFDTRVRHEQLSQSWARAGFRWEF